MWKIAFELNVQKMMRDITRMYFFLGLKLLYHIATLPVVLYVCRHSHNRIKGEKRRKAYSILFAAPAAWRKSLIIKSFIHDDESIHCVYIKKSKREGKKEKQQIRQLYHAKEKNIHIHVYVCIQVPTEKKKQRKNSVDKIKTSWNIAHIIIFLFAIKKHTVSWLHIAFIITAWSH